MWCELDSLDIQQVSISHLRKNTSDAVNIRNTIFSSSLNWTRHEYVCSVRARNTTLFRCVDLVCLSHFLHVRDCSMSTKSKFCSSVYGSSMIVKVSKFLSFKGTIFKIGMLIGFITYIFKLFVSFPFLIQRPVSSLKVGPNVMYRIFRVHSNSRMDLNCNKRS